MYTLKKIKIFFALTLLVVTINSDAQSFYETISDLKLRSGPGVKYKSLGHIKNVEEINVIEKTNSSWFKIEYNGKTGFLSSKFLIPVVEGPKVEETPKIQSEIEKSNYSILYTIVGTTFVLIIVIFSSRHKKKQANDNKIFKHTQTNIKTEKEFKENPNQKSQLNIKIEITESHSASGKGDSKPFKANQKEETNYKNNPISLIIDSVKKNAVEQLKIREQHIQSNEVKNISAPIEDSDITLIKKDQLHLAYSNKANSESFEANSKEETKYKNNLISLIIYSVKKNAIEQFKIRKQHIKSDEVKNINAPIENSDINLIQKKGSVTFGL
jgi:uncharacterized protein YgiM (DUF1202 family)